MHRFTVKSWYLIVLFSLLAVVTCDKEEVTVPYKGSVNCTHKYGNFSFDSSCEYSCEEGYELSMSRPLRCTGSKEWSEQPPTCEGELSCIAKLKKNNKNLNM